MDALKLATGPVTWGVDFADTPGNPPWRQVLDDIAASDVDALELGPVGYLPEDPETLTEALRQRKLEAVGSFVFEDLHDPSKASYVRAVSGRACRAIAAGGGSVLVLIDRPGSERAATAGRSDAAQRLDERRWAAMLDLTAQITELSRAHGLRPAFHPHAGSYVEFADEIERLLSTSDIDLCLDTGHAAYAGIVPERALSDYRDRLAHVHLKDVDGQVLTRVRSERLNFWTAIGEGVFCRLGAGVVNVARCLEQLHAIGYKGFATIEQDRVPGSGTPLEDLAASVALLRAIESGSGAHGAR